MSDTLPALIEAATGFLRTVSGNLGIAFSESLNVDVGFEFDRVEAAPIQEIMGRTEDSLWTVFNLSAPDAADCVLQIPREAALALATLAAGDVVGGGPEILAETDVETLTRASAALAAGLAVGLTNLANTTVEVDSCMSGYGTLALPPMFAMEQHALEAVFNLMLPDAPTHALNLLFTPDFMAALANLTENEAPAATSSATLNESELAAMLSELEGMGDMGAAPVNAASSASAPPFSNFPTAPEEAPLSRGMELIMDIPLDVTVELGRVRMLIRDVLDLASGSIIELDRVAGEPVDLLVNGRLVAKGEVVVIEDNFGIRLTEIVSPADRVAGLGRGR